MTSHLENAQGRLALALSPAPTLAPAPAPALALAFALGALLPLAAACGDDDGEGARVWPETCLSGDGALALLGLDQAYCAPLAELACGAAESEACGCRDLPGWPGDPAACRETLRRRCRDRLALLGPDIDRAEVAACPEAAEGCLAAWRDAREPCALPTDLALERACAGVLLSTARIGGTCDLGLCASGEGACDAAGRCVARPGSGAACTSLCAEGLLCVDGACLAPGGAGAGCAVDAGCEAPLTCQGGLCAPRGAIGAECTVSEECALGLRCEAGQCGPLGQVCSGPADDCGHGGACLTAAGNRCAAERGPGEACERTDQCPDGHYCRYEERVCTPLPGQGEPCGDGVYCAAGLGCGFESGVCAPLPGGGEACALGELGPTLCATDLACSDGSCGPLPGLGEECAGLNECAPGLGCDFTPEGSLCATPAPEGAACTNDTVCQTGLFCDYGTLQCTPYLEVGEACTDGNECGPAGSCVPLPGGTVECVEMPAAGEPCFGECVEGFTCDPPPPEGRCAPPICALLAGTTGG